MLTVPDASGKVRRAKIRPCGLQPGGELSNIPVMTKEDPQAVPGADWFAQKPLPKHCPAKESEPIASDPVLSDPARPALFLDLDGTLLDLAPTPEQVAPEPGLIEVLIRLEARTSGALALVTGRQVAFVDTLFPSHLFTVAGLHGAELRPGPAAGNGLSAIAASPANTASLREAFSRVLRETAAHPGLLAEDKGAAFALHYRKTPGLRSKVESLMAEAAGIAGPGYRLREGKYVVELCPSSADKGAALRNFMASTPFRGRCPVAAGDDLTDEAMFQAVNIMGGLSIRVGDHGAPSAAKTRIATPGAFRAWLRQLAGTPGAGERTHD